MQRRFCLAAACTSGKAARWFARWAAAANDAICVARCACNDIAADNDERMAHSQNMLERGLSLGMESAPGVGTIFRLHLPPVQGTA
ncbi:MAG: hypothetical protein ACI4AL_06560 [Aristaeellaceae bacterium]